MRGESTILPFMDVFTPDERSRIMRAVKSSGTTPERRMAAILRAAGLRASTRTTTLPGRPDFAIRSARVAIFVHGCFWHGHDCPRGGRTPATNRVYWEAKIARNVARDRRVARALRDRGWSVWTVWECALKKTSPPPARLIATIRRRLEAGATSGAGRP